MEINVLNVMGQVIRTLRSGTASPGRYNLTWDGRDSRNKPVPPGTYSVVLEIAREKGTHVTMTAPIACGTTKPASADIKGNTESDGAEIRYGPARR